MLTLLEKVSLLQKAPPFQAIRTESLARVAAIAHEVSFEPRHTLYRENDNPDTMFVVLEGEVSILQNGQESKKLSSYDVAGIMALLASETYPASAVATGAVRTLRIDQQDFYDVLSEDFGVTRGILKCLVGMVAKGS